jgi:8-oxo-dGTP pyrophosphatase MutT (NUDIX family)
MLSKAPLQYEACKLAASRGWCLHQSGQGVWCVRPNGKFWVIGNDDGWEEAFSWLQGLRSPRVRVILPFENEFLLEHLTQPRYPKSMGMVRLPGGEIHPGETPTQAMIREMEEELHLPPGRTAKNSVFLDNDPRPDHAHEYIFMLSAHLLTPGRYVDFKDPADWTDLVPGTQEHPFYIGPDIRSMLQ